MSIRERVNKAYGDTLDEQTKETLIALLERYDLT